MCLIYNLKLFKCGDLLIWNWSLFATGMLCCIFYLDLDWTLLAACCFRLSALSFFWFLFSFIHQFFAFCFQLSIFCWNGLSFRFLDGVKQRHNDHKEKTGLKGFNLKFKRLCKPKWSFISIRKINSIYRRQKIEFFNLWDRFFSSGSFDYCALWYNAVLWKVKKEKRKVCAF